MDLIPTLSKGKISHLLSYPIGAELIFFYDEDTEELSEEREAKLEPAKAG